MAFFFCSSWSLSPGLWFCFSPPKPQSTQYTKTKQNRRSYANSIIIKKKVSRFPPFFYMMLRVLSNSKMSLKFFVFFKDCCLESHPSCLCDMSKLADLFSFFFFCGRAVLWSHVGRNAGLLNLLFQHSDPPTFIPDQRDSSGSTTHCPITSMTSSSELLPPFSASVWRVSG